MSRFHTDGHEGRIGGWPLTGSYPEAIVRAAPPRREPLAELTEPTHELWSVGTERHAPRLENAGLATAAVVGFVSWQIALFGPLPGAYSAAVALWGTAAALAGVWLFLEQSRRAWKLSMTAVSLQALLLLGLCLGAPHAEHAMGLLFCLTVGVALWYEAPRT